MKNEFFFFSMNCHQMCGSAHRRFYQGGRGGFSPPQENNSLFMRKGIFERRPVLGKIYEQFVSNLALFIYKNEKVILLGYKL